MRVGSAGLALLALLDRSSVVHAQSSSSSSSSSSAASATSSGSSSSSNGTVATTIQLPPLYQCTPSTWTYTGPVGAKYLAFFIPNTNNFVETYPLPSVYDDRTSGTFTWTCDLPQGLNVAAQFYILPEGASSVPQGYQASTPDGIINAGSSGSGCLGSNVPSYQQGILSLASSLDPSFKATSDASSPAATGASDSDGGSSTPVGAIVGGVVGGVCGIAIIALGLLYLKRKHDLAVANSGDGLSLYSEKRGSIHHSRYGGGPGSTTGMNAPPPGTYYAHDEHGNTILMMGYPPHAGEEGQPQTPPVPALDQNPFATPASPAPKTTAPVGTLPEPMDESAPSVVSPAPSGAVSSAPLAPPVTPSRATTTTSADFVSAPSSAAPFTPRSERDAFLGHQGLDDPSSFSPTRRT
ncbi:hypothetical protein JCM6882_003139 [Rhodosporidiobolus microsporus]